MRRTDRRGEPLTTTRPEPGTPRPRSRRHVALVVPFVVLAMLQPACGGDDSGGGSGSTATQDPANLQGKSWVVTQILDGEGNTVIVDFGINATFDGSNISGAASCHQYHATYQATGNEISFGPISSTRAACPPDEDPTATQYLTLLADAKTYDIEGRTMSMSNADGTPTIQFSQG